MGGLVIGRNAWVIALWMGIFYRINKIFRIYRIRIGPQRNSEKHRG